MSINRDAIARIIGSARQTGRCNLLEPDGMSLLAAMGMTVPRQFFVAGPDEVPDPLPLPGDKVVVKVVSPEILHKSDVGGVAVVKNTCAAVADCIAAMHLRFRGLSVAGYTINELVAYDPSLGNELLVGLRWTAEFGAVVTFGAGGIYAEFLEDSFKAGKGAAMFSVELSGEGQTAERLKEVAITRLLTGGLRGQRARVDPQALCAILRSFFEVGRAFMPEPVSEIEANPIVVTERGPVALDAVVKLGGAARPAAPERPIRKIGNLLHPRAVAIAGVSERLNPGHIVLNNLLREGFDRRRIHVLKAGSEEIEGCRCWPNISSLPERVDLFILAVSAAQIPDLITEIADGNWAESMIVIPGGLEEKRGTEAIVTRMHAAIARARASEGRGPVINGGNCLGITSVPGRYDTMFIPEYKLPRAEGGPSPLAILSSSGAFAVSKGSKLAAINPRYSISVGNQVDLTIGDYLTYLSDDITLDVFSIYAEGFRPMDGLRFLRAAKKITRSGRTVILYRAGRTQAGKSASASHTAAIAGDYAVTCELARQAGVIVADSLADFEDLTSLFVNLREKEVTGVGLGALSNAGFECVAIADNLGALRLARFTDSTAAKLGRIFEQCRIEEVVDVHNPLDLTPIADDHACEDAVRAVLLDPNVDIGVVGCVPLTGALNTLAPGPGHRENVYETSSLAMRMIKLHRESKKAWVAVVDGGALYDPMARLLEQNRVPTFRTADRALHVLNLYCSARVRTRSATLA